MPTLKKGLLCSNRKVLKKMTKKIELGALKLQLFSFFVTNFDKQIWLQTY